MVVVTAITLICADTLRQTVTVYQFAPEFSSSVLSEITVDPSV